MKRDTDHREDVQRELRRTPNPRARWNHRRPSRVDGPMATRVLEGVDVELEKIILVLRRRREHDAWPAQTAPSFRKELRAAARIAERRGFVLREKLEFAMERHAAFAQVCRELISQFDVAVSPAPYRNEARGFASSLARTQRDPMLYAYATQHRDACEGFSVVNTLNATHFEPGEVTELLERDDALEWSRAIARSELQFAFETVPVTQGVRVSLGASMISFLGHLGGASIVSAFSAAAAGWLWFHLGFVGFVEVSDFFERALVGGVMATAVGAVTFVATLMSTLFVSRLTNALQVHGRTDDPRLPS